MPLQTDVVVRVLLLLLEVVVVVVDVVVVRVVIVVVVVVGTRGKTIAVVAHVTRPPRPVEQDAVAMLVEAGIGTPPTIRLPGQVRTPPKPVVQDVTVYVVCTVVTVTTAVVGDGSGAPPRLGNAALKPSPGSAALRPRLPVAPAPRPRLSVPLAPMPPGPMLTPTPAVAEMETDTPRPTPAPTARIVLLDCAKPAPPLAPMNPWPVIPPTMHASRMLPPLSQVTIGAPVVAKLVVITEVGGLLSERVPGSMLTAGRVISLLSDKLGDGKAGELLERLVDGNVISLSGTLGDGSSVALIDGDVSETVVKLPRISVLSVTEVVGRLADSAVSMLVLIVDRSVSELPLGIEIETETDDKGVASNVPVRSVGRLLSVTDGSSEDGVYELGSTPTAIAPA